MKQLNQPLYTVESFINNFIGNSDNLKELEAQEDGELYMKWNGMEIYISADKTFQDGLITDTVGFTRQSPGIFELDLQADHYWYMTINFSDGGLVKHRIYRVSDYII